MKRESGDKCKCVALEYDIELAACLHAVFSSVVFRDKLDGEKPKKGGTLKLSTSNIEKNGKFVVESTSSPFIVKILTQHNPEQQQKLLKKYPKICSA